MKPIALILACVGASALVAFLVPQLRPEPAARAAAPASVAPDETERLAKVVAALEAKNEDLSRALDELRAQLAAGSGGSRVPKGEIEAAVARALESQALEAAPKSAAAPSPAAARRDAEALFADLASGKLSWEDAQALWKEAGDLGMTDELVAMFEARAKDHANEPGAQLDLGKAYLQKVFKAGGGPEAGLWATKADKSFDAALALDDHHWEARFQKAVSLSFWPPMMGKQGSAVKEFETLIAQQKVGALKPEYAQTHLFLGNMYQQMGQASKALATWKSGLELFPGNASLAAQIASAQGG